MKNIDASLIEKYINGDDLGEYSSEHNEYILTSLV